MNTLTIYSNEGRFQIQVDLTYAKESRIEVYEILYPKDRYVWSWS